MSHATSKARLSADSVVDEATGDITTPAPAAPEREPMSEAEITSKTKRLIQFRDFVQSRLLAWGAGDINRTEEFKLEGWEVDMLCDVYHDLIRDLGYIPKWFDVLIAESMVLIPRALKVFNYRKLENENKRLKQQIAYLQQAQAQAQQQQQYQPAAQTAASMPAATPAKQRSKAKTAWLIDENGFFQYTPGLQYLKAPERREKPQLTQENYELLVQHNGKEFVDKIFKIG